MASFIVNINHNDNLEAVIRKCNSNFKAMIAQLKQQAKIAKRDTEAETEDQIAEAIGESVGGIVNLIEDEAEHRRQGDETLEDSITGLATVASTGDYNDLINTPTIPASCPFPVGYVMQMTNSSDPNVLYPDTTWMQINGVFLLGSSNNHALGTTGGTETHNHNNGKTGSTTLTAAQSGLPAHTHGFTNPKIPNHVHTMNHGHGFTQPKVHRAQNAGSGTNRYAIQGTDDNVNVSAYGGSVTNYTGNTGNPTSLGSTTGGSVGAVTNGAQTASSGHDHSIAAADNMPPYKVVNMWERTA